jgi:hypothetical protein
MFKITTKFQTVATTGYVGPVSRNENRAAHGGIRHLQARKGKKGLLGRYVNSNGRHQEVGESFPMHQLQLSQWISMGRCDN